MKTAIQWPGASGTGRTTYPSGTFPRKDSSSSAHSRDGSGPVISLIGDTPQVYRYFLREAPHCLSPRRKSRPQAGRALGPGQALPLQNSQGLPSRRYGSLALRPGVSNRSPPAKAERSAGPSPPARLAHDGPGPRPDPTPGRGASEAGLEVLRPALRRSETVIERGRGCGSVTFRPRDSRETPCASTFSTIAITRAPAPVAPGS